MPASKSPQVSIISGYQTGLIARITEMHAVYYSQTSGFGQRFESVVAKGLADFCDRLDKPCNRVWTAVVDGEIVGSIAIDGEDLGNNHAHLRWFILDGLARGSGVGRQLLATALEFTEQQGFTEIHLWTFSGLDAARHLYETYGFKCVEEYTGEQWGSTVLEQHYSKMTATMAADRLA
jgi:GNAT superfamily N-acetyltransferase